MRFTLARERELLDFLGTLLEFAVTSPADKSQFRYKQRELQTVKAGVAIWVHEAQTDES